MPGSSTEKPVNSIRLVSGRSLYTALIGIVLMIFAGGFGSGFLAGIRASEGRSTLGAGQGLTAAVEAEITPTPARSPTLTQTLTATTKPTQTSSPTATPTQTETPYYTGTASATSTPTQVDTATLSPEPSPSGFIVIGITASAKPGDYAYASIRTQPGTACTLAYTTPSGRQSTAAGLGAATAGNEGDCTWTWKIGSSTNPGSGWISITAGGHSNTYPIVITR